MAGSQRFVAFFVLFSVKHRVKSASVFAAGAEWVVAEIIAAIAAIQ
jgi:hypothetical protein